MLQNLLVCLILNLNCIVVDPKLNGSALILLSCGLWIRIRIGNVDPYLGYKNLDSSLSMLCYLRRSDLWPMAYIKVIFVLKFKFL
jgi:hypothetical protein